MNQEYQIIERQIQRWTQLAPILIIITFLIMFLPAERPWWLAAAALIGTPISWHWRLLGAASAIIMAFIAFAIQLSANNSPQTFWLLGLTCALALSFFINAYCRDEIDTLLEEICPDVTPPDDSKLRALEDELAVLTMRQDEALKQIKNEYSLREQQFTDQKNSLDAALQASKDQLIVAKEQLLASEERQESLLQELFQRRHDYTLLKQHCEQLQSELSLSQQELQQCRAKADELLVSCESKESVLQQQLEEVQLRLANVSKQPEPAAVAPQVEEEPPAKPAKPASKSRAPKQTKTTNWANTILSRCSEPHDQNQ